MKRYEIEEYITSTGKSPFADWLSYRKPKALIRRILSRLERVRFGNFGDYKAISGTQNLYELRDHSGPGYRIYFTISKGSIVVLLAGSEKRDQDRMITKAKEYLKDYLERN